MSSTREAIALVYDGAQAPTLTAKGEGELAEQIIQLAIDYEVPIYENADLARMLTQLELGDQIPEALYRTIAEIIAFAWYLKGKRPDGFNPDGDQPQPKRLEQDKPGQDSASEA
ncbi:MAG TPA: flagellar biosynthesis protein FlhB [Pseudomonas sabulinigri]|jgi:flagellar biosynthesis protein|uniref:Flagellar biosynthesis protein FlhB n=1 Tax=marine sediment metagenome TaxID=412755 RepID=A0A0F9YES4_9ZZZZ|nr:flagellar biosynthesis protein FlhB [Halopseudomonas sabulinigri]HEC51172.1 flagellar biosynthesis protein FlhB [Halopseudomonas sabulinigri]|tara:strand:+ start:3869 stop:4210 length:342 start_codon:yes stop_codon:yes gene_type:complete